MCAYLLLVCTALTVVWFDRCLLSAFLQQRAERVRVAAVVAIFQEYVQRVVCCSSSQEHNLLAAVCRFHLLCLFVCTGHRALLAGQDMLVCRFCLLGFLGVYSVWRTDNKLVRNTAVPCVLARSTSQFSVAVYWQTRGARLVRLALCRLAAGRDTWLLFVGCPHPAGCVCNIRLRH